MEKDFSGFDVIVFDEPGHFDDCTFSTDETIVLTNRNRHAAKTEVLNVYPNCEAKTAIIK